MTIITITYGINIEIYKEQLKTEGLDRFKENERIVLLAKITILILGDNFFYGQSLSNNNKNVTDYYETILLKEFFCTHIYCIEFFIVNKSFMYQLFKKIGRNEDLNTTTYSKSESYKNINRF